MARASWPLPAACARLLRTAQVRARLPYPGLLRPTFSSAFFPVCCYKLRHPSQAHLQPTKFPRLDGPFQPGSIEINCPLLVFSSFSPCVTSGREAPSISNPMSASSGVNVCQSPGPPTSLFRARQHCPNTVAIPSCLDRNWIAVNSCAVRRDANQFKHRYSGTPPLPSASSTASATRDRSTPR